MILTYHNIGEGPSDTWISHETFKAQMALIAAAGFKVVTLEEYDPYDSKHLAIFFDDGRRNVDTAIPTLRRYGFPFYVAVVGKLIGSSDEFLGEQDFHRIREAGGYLAWYTCSHKDLTKLSMREIRRELKNPYGSDVLAYPYCKNDDRVVPVARELGYRFARSGNGYAKMRFGNLSLDSEPIYEYTNLRFINDKIVRYIDIAYLAYPCNLRCHYCYVGQHATEEERRRIRPTKYTPEDLEKALNIRRMGGKCIITFCASGETLLLPRSVEYIKAILRAGHFVHISTNLTVTKHIGALLALPDEMRERILFKASFQYLELKRKGMLDRYAENFRKILDAGVSCSPELISVDELIPLIPEIKKWSLKHLGALPQLNIPRDEAAPGIKLLSRFSLREFGRIWEPFYSELLRYKLNLWEKPIKSFCYAGKYSLFVMLNSGEMLSCHAGEKIGNFFEGEALPVKPVGCCPNTHCFISHAWLGFGACPSVTGTNYLLERDRVMPNGRHWISERCRHAFRQRVCDNNELLPPAEEKKLYRRSARHLRRRKGIRRKILRFLINLIPISKWRRNFRRRMFSSFS